jgi:hypothetical protein
MTTPLPNTDDAGHGSFLPADADSPAWFARVAPWQAWHQERMNLLADGMTKDEIIAMIGPEPAQKPWLNADGTTPGP